MPGPGSTVLLLHGSGPGTTGAAAWAPLVAALEPRHRCITPDLPGFAPTGPGPGPFRSSLRDPVPVRDEYLTGPGPVALGWAAWAVDVLDSLDVQSCAVVGNSAGGALALALARARARVVTKVVAVGTMGYPMPISPALDALWGCDDARTALELIFAGAVGEDAVAARAAAMRAQPHYRELFPTPRQRWVDALSLSVGELAQIEQPVLLIHGSADRIVPLANSVLPLLRTLPDARAHVFGGAGHATPLERTPEFNALITAFLGAG